MINKPYVALIHDIVPTITRHAF